MYGLKGEEVYFLSQNMVLEDLAKLFGAWNGVKNLIWTNNKIKLRYDT